MIWLDDLYISDNITRKKDKLIKKINKGKITKNLYVIALSRNSSDLLDVFQANILKQDYYKKQDIIVVGLAKSEDAAYDLVKTIVDDCYAATNGVDVKAFLKERLGETKDNA